MRMRLFVGMMVAAAGISLAAQANQAVPVNQRGVIQRFKNTGVVTVESVTMNFFPANGRVLTDPRTKGGQFVRVAVNVTNTSATAFTVAYTSFHLLTSDGAKHSLTSSINRGNSNDRLATTKLEPEASVSGALYYEIAATETLEQLALVFEGYAGTEKKDFRIAFSADAAAAPAPAHAAAPAPEAEPKNPAPAPKTGPEQLAADLAATMAASLVGPWVMDEAKSKAAPDGNTAGVMKTLELTADGAFTALYGTKGTYTFDGQTLVVTYANSPGLQKKGAIEGAWLKFPAPAGLNRYCYMKRPD